MSELNEHEGQWADALKENGTYDLNKAKQASDAATSHYTAGLKKSERILWGYLIFCVAVAVLSLDSFLFTTSNKVMIGCAIAFLAAIETTILMKLWYWIVNTRLTLQREIRQWQAHGALPESVGFNPTWWLAEMSFGRPGLSRWERRAWLAGLILVAIATSQTVVYWEITKPSAVTLVERVKVAADGSAVTTTDAACQPEFNSSSASFWFQTSVPNATIRSYDDRGRELPYDEWQQNGNRCFSVHLIEPVPMGEVLRYKQVQTTPAAATREGDLWTYKGDLTYSYSTNQFFVTVELPKGAEVVSGEPSDKASIVDGVPTLKYWAIRGFNERFEYKIQYRLRSKAGAEKPAS
jgi:hypothetical protein